MKNNINLRPMVLAAIILSVGMYRLLVASASHGALANFTPLGAMALFGGCYYKNRMSAYLVPLLTLWLTDIVLNRFVYFNEWVFFYDGFSWVYASFAIMVFAGSLITHVTLKSVVTAAIAGALIHWVVSDTGIWLNGECIPAEGPYAPTFNTFIQTMEIAIPSMSNMLIGNLVFGALLFAAFEFMQRKFPALQFRTSYQ